MNLQSHSVSPAAQFMDHDIQLKPQGPGELPQAKVMAITLLNQESQKTGVPLPEVFQSHGYAWGGQNGMKNPNDMITPKDFTAAAIAAEAHISPLARLLDSVPNQDQATAKTGAQAEQGSVVKPSEVQVAPSPDVAASAAVNSILSVGSEGVNSVLAGLVMPKQSQQQGEKVMMKPFTPSVETPEFVKGLSQTLADIARAMPSNKQFSNKEIMDSLTGILAVPRLADHFNTLPKTVNIPDTLSKLLPDRANAVPSIKQPSDNAMKRLPLEAMPTLPSTLGKLPLEAMPTLPSTLGKLDKLPKTIDIPDGVFKHLPQRPEVGSQKGVDGFQRGPYIIDPSKKAEDQFQRGPHIINPNEKPGDHWQRGPHIINPNEKPGDGLMPAVILN